MISHGITDWVAIMGVIENCGLRLRIGLERSGDNTSCFIH